MALNVLVVDDSSVMRAMVIKTTQMCRLPLGEIHQAANADAAANVRHAQCGGPTAARTAPLLSIPLG